MHLTSLYEICFKFDTARSETTASEIRRDINLNKNWKCHSYPIENIISPLESANQVTLFRLIEVNTTQDFRFSRRWLRRIYSSIIAVHSVERESTFRERHVTFALWVKE